MENWNTWAIDLIVLVEAFHPKIFHFLLLKSPLGAPRKESRILLNLVTMMDEAPPKKRGSSTNYEWLIFLTLWSICNPCRLSFSHSFSNFLLRDSTTMMKIWGESGQPCRRYLLAWKKLDFSVSRIQIACDISASEIGFIRSVFSSRITIWGIFSSMHCIFARSASLPFE